MWCDHRATSCQVSLPSRLDSRRTASVLCPFPARRLNLRLRKQESLWSVGSRLTPCRLTCATCVLVPLTTIPGHPSEPALRRDLGQRPRSFRFIARFRRTSTLQGSLKSKSTLQASYRCPQLRAQMLHRSVHGALKLQWRFARAAVGDLGAPAYASHHHSPKSAISAGLAASKAFSSSCSARIQFGWGSRTSGAASDQAVAASAAAAQSSMGMQPSQPLALQQAPGIQHEHRGIQHEHALVSRCAAVWQIPAEILQANVQALADVLHPCGRDTTAHALWVMVRCPEMRHADEQQLRSTLRHLSSMVQHLDLDKPTLLAAVYRKPWMIRAAAARAHRARAAAAAKAQGSRLKQSSRAACSRQGARNSSSDADFSDSEEDSSSGNGRYMAPWHHEALLLMLELSTSSSRSANSSSRTVSPAPAMAAVRAYLTAVESAQQLRNSWKAVASILPGSAGMQAAAAAAVSVTGARHDSSSSSSSSYDALQQLLAACPLLAMLPRDVLLSRWQLLLSGLLGSHQAAAALLRASPYIVVSYADLQDSRCPTQLQELY